MWGAFALGAISAIEAEKVFQQSIAHLPEPEREAILAKRLRAAKEQAERDRQYDAERRNSSGLLGAGVIGFILGMGMS